MSKLANPWKCDNEACGILRANDTNHWLLLYAMPGPPVVCIEPWNDGKAEDERTKHACGVPCGLKIAAKLVMEIFFPADVSSTGKDVADGQS